MIPHSNLSPLGVMCLPAYFAAMLAIGWLTRGSQKQSANAFLNASRSLPLPIVVASFLAANCGALEVVGLSAMAAQYGVRTFHFYWIGAIPAMIFLGLVVLPVYRGSGVRSVPEYLGIRFGNRMEVLNAVLAAVAMLMLGGISLYAMAQVLGVLLKLSFVTGVLLSAGVVLIYVLLGGIRATIYTEVFQLGVMVAGLFPLAWRSLIVLHNVTPREIPFEHAWTGLQWNAPQRDMDSLGIVFGLGFILSFGYWCTDFVLMQRAFAARTESQARQVPLWAGFGKLLFGLLVVLPGLAAVRVIPSLVAERHYDQSLPLMMTRLYGPTYLGLGFTALVASLMSGLAANISGVSAIWTEDLYRRRVRPGMNETHYLRMGRASMAFALAISLSASVISFHFLNLMDHVQLIFSLLNAPFWAVFLLGVLTRRVRERGALLGFLSGTTVAGLHQLAMARGWFHYGSTMSSNFHVAIYGFCTTTVVSLLASSEGASERKPGSPVMVFRGHVLKQSGGTAGLLLLSALLLSLCVLMNWLWR